jgi:hypothetical protein
MCLEPRKENSDKPYNESKFRWKIASRYIDKLISSYRGYIYKNNQWMIAKGNPNGSLSSRDIGFHVFITRDDARNYKKSRSWMDECVVIKVEVREFNTSGHFKGYRSETWKKMKVLKQ